MRKILAVSAAALVVGAAHASSMNLSFESCASPSGLGSFTGSMNWSYAGGCASAGFLTVTLSNTSNASNGGFLTGFAFNAVPTSLGGSLVSAMPTWSYISNVPAHPYENFDFGAAVGGNFLGGGNPSSGIGAAVVAAAQRHGLIIRPLAGDIVAFCPPLIITLEQIEEMFAAVHKALDEVEHQVTKEGLRAA